MRMLSFIEEHLDALRRTLERSRRDGAAAHRSAGS